MTLLEQWLFKAEQDLGSAQLLLDGKFYGTAIYHTQQAAEKAFKPTFRTSLADFHYY
jgi:HEPN domain-containing protein